MSVSQAAEGQTRMKYQVCWALGLLSAQHHCLLLEPQPGLRAEDVNFGNDGSRDTLQCSGSLRCPVLCFLPICPPRRNK